MSWLLNFLSKFHHEEEMVSQVSKDLLKHVEDEFTKLEACLKELQAAVFGHAPEEPTATDVQPTTGE